MHPQDTCISFDPICSLVLHSLLVFLSQLRPTIPLDLERLNQCLCRTTSQQPSATADIIHLFLLTNLSIHSPGNETSPFCKLFVFKIWTATWIKHTNMSFEEKRVWKVAHAQQQHIISGLKFCSQFYNVCKRGNQPKESLL